VARSGERAVHAIRFFEKKGRAGVRSQTAPEKKQKHHCANKSTAHVNLKPLLTGKLRGPEKLPG
jgi:hypothetical protein